MKKIFAKHNKIIKKINKEFKITKSFHSLNEYWTIINNEIVLFVINGDGYVQSKEADFPGYFDCPLSFLEEVPVKNKEWRRFLVIFNSMPKRRARPMAPTSH